MPKYLPHDSLLDQSDPVLRSIIWTEIANWTTRKIIGDLRAYEPNAIITIDYFHTVPVVIYKLSTDKEAVSNSIMAKYKGQTRFNYQGTSCDPYVILCSL